MTKNKCIRLIKELVEKYGDIDIIQIYDYYASRLIKEDSTWSDDVMLGTIKLSQMAEVITCRGDYENLVKIVEGKSAVQRQYVVVQESKEKYDSEEQIQARANHSRGLSSFLSAGNLFHTYHNVYRPDFILNPHTTPKEFGMAMDNHRKHGRRG